MKWIATAFAALLLAVLILSIPAPVFTTEASARRGCSEGGVCTCSEGKMGCMKPEARRRPVSNVARVVWRPVAGTASRFRDAAT
jgi:hypothetical protein